jgi:hypothetical protein
VAAETPLVTSDFEDVAPDVDYRVTSRRPQFADLPPVVKAALAESAGAPIVEPSPSVTSGFTGAYAGLLGLRDGRQVFAKAAGPEAPFALEAIPREVRILRVLDGRVTAPRVVGAGAADDWEVVVLEAIDGHVPGMPWTQAEAEAAHRACLELAALPTDAVTGVTDESFAETVGADAVSLTCLDELASGARDWPRGIPRPSRGQANDLAALGHSAADLLVGDRLVHSDLRSDNMLVEAGGRVRIVDWNWTAQGPAWVDFVGLLPLMAHQGLDADSYVARSPLLDGVPADAVDSFLAVIIGYMAEHAGHPTWAGTLEVLRAHQRQMARTFLVWLAHRRGWELAGTAQS